MKLFIRDYCYKRTKQVVVVLILYLIINVFFVACDEILCGFFTNLQISIRFETV